MEDCDGNKTELKMNWNKIDRGDFVTNQRESKEAGCSIMEEPSYSVHIAIWLTHHNFFFFLHFCSEYLFYLKKKKCSVRIMFNIKV